MRFSRHFALLTAVEICCRIANTESFSEHIMADGCSNSYCNSACQCNDIYSRCTYITTEYSHSLRISRVVVPSCCCACATAFYYAHIVSLPWPLTFVRSRWALGCESKNRPEYVYKMKAERRFKMPIYQNCKSRSRAEKSSKNPTEKFETIHCSFGAFPEKKI